ncbi:pol-like protein [Aphelenchoides avenae]|nr:pol-like protein [Aphelenchus avenae]
MLDADFMAANTGEATRINRHDGSGTTPDVTLHHVASAHLVQWEAVKELGSDHLPILVEVRLRGRLPREYRRTFWNPKKANWPKFRQLMTQNLENWTCTDDQLAKKNNDFATAVMTAAEQSIPKGNRRRHKPFWSAEVADACRVRNNARAHGTPEEYAEAAANARRSVVEAKQKSWREYTSTLNAKTDDNRTWRVIKSLDGRTGQPRPSAAISRNGRLATTPKAKANAFIKEYASVGRLHHTKDDRRFHNTVVDRLKGQCRRDHCRDFGRQELEAALKELMLKKSPGEDGVSNDMLVNLPERGREALLQMGNASWRTKRCPGRWTSAVIIPIPKAGKDSSNVQSYRPISLTSCIAKTIERMIKNRLADWLERNNNLSAAQAGFRKMRSTEDQLLRVVQSVSDGFNAKKPPKRTVMTLVDFSRAFDRVWRTGHKMLEKGVPLCLIRWIRAFLCDRRARVQIDDAKSRSYTLKCGTPQGSVLSPLLFLIFIDDILQGMPQEVQASLDADDLALWSQHERVETATEAMQTALNRLLDWSRQWKMEVNVDKTYSIVFTTDPHEARYRPDLRYNGQEVPYDATPTFLGLTLDRTLSFNAHAKKVRAKMEKRLSMLSALRGTTWGCRKKLMRNLYTAYVRSVADYGGAAWMPAAAKTTINHIETANKRAARIITGCTRTTPSEMLLDEANLLPTEHRRDLLCCIAYEKAVRLPDDNPRNTAASHPQRQRLRSQPSFRELAKGHPVQRKLDQYPRKKLEAIPPSAPWKPPPNITLHTELRRPIKRTDDPGLKRQTITSLRTEVQASSPNTRTDGTA